MRILRSISPRAVSVRSIAFPRRVAIAGIASTALALAALSARASGQTIDTRTGQPLETLTGGETEGELFTAPTGFSHLNDFSFWIAQSGQYKGMVYLWDGTGIRAQGSPLYTSVDRSTPATDLTKETFSVGDLALTPGQTYVAFIRSSNGDEFNFGFVNAVNNGSSGVGPGVSGPQEPADPTTSDWGTFGGDLQFEAHFSSGTSTVPEPSSLALLGTGLAGLVPMLRRKKRRG